MHFEAINWLAVIVATISAFALGALWYSPMLFGKAWMAANGFSEEGLAEGFNPAKVYGISFVFTLVMALNLAGFLAGYASFYGFALRERGLTYFPVALGLSMYFGLFAAFSSTLGSRSFLFLDFGTLGMDRNHSKIILTRQVYQCHTFRHLQVRQVQHVANFHCGNVDFKIFGQVLRQTFNGDFRQVM